MSERVTTTEAARILSVSPSRVHQMDEQLQPERVGVRRVRVFDRSRVEALAVERAAGKPGQP